MSKIVQYQVFVTVYEVGTVTSAANLLNLSVSAVSKQISALESSLRVKLFERTNRNLKPTRLAVQFYADCRAILNKIDDAEQRLTSVSGEVSGFIRITVSKSLIKSGLIELLSRFAQQYSKVRFIIDSSEEVQDLQGFDFAFRLGKLENHSNLIAIPLQDVSPIMCATPEYIKRCGEPKSYKELSKHRLCLMPYSLLSNQVRAYFKSKDLKFTDQHDQTNDIDTVLEMIRTNLCIGMVLNCSVSKELMNNQLVEVLPDERIPKKKLYLVFKKDEFELTRNRTFIDFIKLCYHPGAC